jgi:YiiM-like, 3-alpha helix domain
MPALLYSHGRPGFYMRVLEEGEVGAGDEIERIAVGREAMSVREVSALLYLPGHTPAGLRRALAIPALFDGVARLVPGPPRTARQGSGRQPGARPALHPTRVAGAAAVSRCRGTA